MTHAMLLAEEGEMKRCGIFIRKQVKNLDKDETYVQSDTDEDDEIGRKADGGYDADLEDEFDPANDHVKVNAKRGQQEDDNDPFSLMSFILLTM